MQFYFIGGLGGNGYHLAPLIDELGFPVTFLDPYREMIQTEKDLCAWFQDQIGQDEEICLLGHSLGGDLARYLAAEFPQIRALDSLGWGLPGYGNDSASGGRTRGYIVLHAATSLCDCRRSCVSRAR